MTAPGTGGPAEDAQMRDDVDRMDDLGVDLQNAVNRSPERPTVLVSRATLREYLRRREVHPATVQAALKRPAMYVGPPLEGETETEHLARAVVAVLTMRTYPL